MSDWAPPPVPSTRPFSPTSGPELCVAQDPLIKSNSALAMSRLREPRYLRCLLMCTYQTICCVGSSLSPIADKQKVWRKAPTHAQIHTRSSE